MEIFRLQNVTHQFNALTALREISFTVHAGERVALVGPSGAGKSTLLRLLNGSIFPSKGQVCVLGDDLGHLSPRRLRATQRKIGTIYQQFHLVDNLRVIHNVNAGHLGRWSLPKALGSLLFPRNVQTAAQALAQVGIPEKLYERTGSLSGGQQQRVAIARVLVQAPQAILADEPIASLDPERSREVMDLLRDLSDQTGVTLVTSLHDVPFALSHFDRLIGLREGQLLFDAAPGEVSKSQLEPLYKIQQAAQKNAGL